MQLRLKSMADVRLFSLAISLVAVVGNFALQAVIYPPGTVTHLWFPSLVIAVSLAAPISYFVGVRMLDIHKLTEQLEHVVSHDALTETCSRMRFYEHVAALETWPQMVIAADIDHFKAVNDRYGHQAGDAVLKQFATTLVRNCREDDLVARFGGEEFVILLRAGTEAEAVATAERLRACVETRDYVISGAEVAITASFGVAQIASAEEIDVSLHRADEALYRAKRSGRNRVCVHDPASSEFFDASGPWTSREGGASPGGGDAQPLPPPGVRTVSR